MMATLDIRRENYKLLKANSFLSLTLLIPAIEFHNHYNNCFLHMYCMYIHSFIYTYVYAFLCIYVYAFLCIYVYRMLFLLGNVSISMNAML